MPVTPVTYSKSGGIFETLHQLYKRQLDDEGGKAEKPDRLLQHLETSHKGDKMWSQIFTGSGNTDVNHGSMACHSNIIEIIVCRI